MEVESIIFTCMFNILKTEITKFFISRIEFAFDGLIKAILLSLV